MQSWSTKVLFLTPTSGNKKCLMDHMKHLKCSNGPIRSKLLQRKEEQPRLKRHVSLIGGRQDEGETPLQCAKRELLEETGYISNDWELYMATDPYIKMEWKIYTFIARNCQKKQAQQLDPGEKITIKKISFSQFLRAIQSTKLPAKELTLHVFGEINQSKTFLSTFKKKIFPTNT